MRSIVKYLTIICLLCVPFKGIAQDQMIYNDYINTQGILNPAYSGTRGETSMLGIFRSQWIGFKDAPMTGTINVHTPLSAFGKRNPVLRRMGAGIVIQNDNLGLTNTFDFLVAASYQIDVNRNTKCSFGLDLGFRNFRVRGSDAITTDYGDPMFMGDISKFGFNAGFGAQLYTDKTDNNYFVGFSIPKFFTTKYDTDKQVIKNTVSGGDLHMFLYGGYIFAISRQSNVLLKPTALFRIVPGAPLTIDISMWAGIPIGTVSKKKGGSDWLWLGLSYRTVNEVIFLVEYNFKRNFTVGYSFDYSISEIMHYAKAGSHELSFKYDLEFGTGKSKPGNKGKSMRYF